jgi:hypothetical protein
MGELGVPTPEVVASLVTGLQDPYQEARAAAGRALSALTARGARAFRHRHEGEISVHMVADLADVG